MLLKNKMRLKAGPNLIRQTITQLWQYNFFIQKPYKIENIFLTVFKYIYLIKIFLITFRNSKIYLNNKKLKEKIKQNSYLIPDFSNLKLLNFYFEKKNKNLIIFCNIFSRTNFFTEFNNRLKNKNILFLLEKKLKKNLYTHNFIKKFIYKLPKQLKQKNTKNIPQKFLNCFILKKVKSNKKKTELKKIKIFWKKYQIFNQIVLRQINTLKKKKKKLIIIKKKKKKKK